MSLFGSVRIRIRNTALLKYVFSGGTAFYGILIQYRYSLLMIVRADTSSLIMLFLSPSGPGVFILHLTMSHKQFGFGEKNKCTHKKKIATKWQENNNVVKYFLLKVEGNMRFRNGKYTYIFMPLLIVFFVLNDLCVEQETETWRTTGVCSSQCCPLATQVFKQNICTFCSFLKPFSNQVYEKLFSLGP